MVLLCSRVRSPSRYSCERNLLWAIRDYSPILVSQETHQGAISPEHLPSGCTSYQNFNNVDDAALTSAPTTSMGQLTDLIAQSSLTYPVSKQKVDH
jgi:hypothetical protein